MPFYSVLLAAGSVAFEMLFANRKRLLLSYLATLPLEATLQYQNVISLGNVVKIEHDSTGEVHHLYADMLGWESMVAIVAEVYHHLSPSEQKQCVILAGNYGEAGAIDLLGAELGLPKAISAHNNYYLWGTKGHTGEVVILFGQRAEPTKTMFASVEQAATISSDHAGAVEKHLPVYVCRNPKVPLAQLWPSLRYFE